MGKTKVQDLTAPSLLSDEHDVDSFDCSEPTLNDWLKKRAAKNNASDASRCFVICNENNEVVGYYSLSAGAISRELAPKSMQRNMPDSLPVLVLGRLAIDKNYHNKGLGSALLRDAMIRSVNIAQDAGVFAILIHSLSDKAKQFYISRGLVESPLQPMTLFMTLATIRDILTKES
ncbi:MAG: GNAT family N-acetyltransferase [Gammaproteobacteria bacterium RIFCSPHIGHO2_12_FULL_38_11]|nr:MAG: GNAT family N-acetyltransferase [Gammaproteobacteria bacterium RIFCSPHIGHO2_12_FULL_38_11]